MKNLEKTEGVINQDPAKGLVFAEIALERLRQDEKWGADREIPSIHPLVEAAVSTAVIGSISQFHGVIPELQAKHNCKSCFDHGIGSWAIIAVEEMAEVIEAATDNERRQELVQLAAVIVAWIENIDRRSASLVMYPNE